MHRPALKTALALALTGSVLVTGACSDDEPRATSAPVSATPDVMAVDVPERTVRDDAGREVTVPVEPQRVMVLNEELLDAAIVLGVSPIGISLGRDQTTPAAYLQDLKPELTYLATSGLPDAPDVGAVLLAEPDLVVAGDATTPEVLADLDAIAPTYVARVDSVEWTQTVRNLAAALGREDQAETWVRGNDVRTLGVRRAIADAGNAGRSVTLALWTPEGPVVLDPSSFAARVAESVGLTVATGPAPATGTVVPLGALPPSDRLFAFAFDTLGPGGEALTAALASPELAAHPAVAAGNVSVVEGSAWATRGAPRAAQIVLDDLLAAFGGQPRTNG